MRRGIASRNHVLKGHILFAYASALVMVIASSVVLQEVKATEADGSQVQSPVPPSPSSSILTQPIGFYDNATKATVYPNGTISIEGGNKIGDDPGILDDILPGPDGRLDALVEIVGEPAISHEGGSGNVTYLEILQSRHDSVKNQMQQEGLNVTLNGDTYYVSNMIFVNALAIDVPTIASFENVSEVKQSQTLYPQLDVSGPTIHADEMRALGYTGSGVTIAILDTGAYAFHESLDDMDDDWYFRDECASWDPPILPLDSNCKIRAFHDFTIDSSGNDWRTRWDWPAYDDDGHGTHVASIAAGTRGDTGGGTDYIGMAPGAFLVVGKVCKKQPTSPATCEEQWILGGLDWIEELKTVGYQHMPFTIVPDIKVISMSLGFAINGYGDSGLETRLDGLVDTGYVVVAAAGNRDLYSGPRHTVYLPATAKKVISVGASDDHNSPPGSPPGLSDDSLWPESALGPTGDYRIKPDVVAPGVNIMSAALSPPWGYEDVTGTSAAAPHIAGLAALLLESHGTWSPRYVKASLINTAIDLEQASGLDKEPTSQGAGLVDAIEADSAQALLWADDTPDEVMLSFGPHLLPADFSGTIDFAKTVFFQSLIAEERTYDLSIDSQDIATNPCLSASTDVPSVTLDPSATTQAILTVTVNDCVGTDYYDGDVVALDSVHGEELRLPFMIHLSRPMLNVDPQVTNTESYFFVVAPLPPEQAWFVADGPGGPIRVDIGDWSVPYPARAGAVASFPASSSGSGEYTVTFHWIDQSVERSTIAGTLLVDIDSPQVEVSVRELTRNTARIQMGSSEDLVRQWIDDKPIRFEPDMLHPIEFQDILYPVDVATFGNEIHVVWHEIVEGIMKDPATRILYRRSADLGRTWWPLADALEIVRSEDLVLGVEIGLPLNPRISVEGQYVHVVWLDDSNSKVWYSRSADGGTTWDDAVTLNSPAAGFALYFAAPSVSVSNEVVHVVWSDWRDYPSLDDGSAVYYRRGGSNGVDWGIPEQRVSALCSTPCREWFTDVVATSSGVHVVWEKDDSLGTRVLYTSSPDGFSWVAEQTLADPSASPKISGRGDRLHAVFSGVYYERSLDDGKNWDGGEGEPPPPFVPRFLAPGIYPYVATDGRKVQATWIRSWAGMNFFGVDSHIIYDMQSLDAGVTWASETAISEEPQLYAFPTYNDLGAPVGMDTYNEPVAVWKNMFARNRFIYYSRFVEPVLRLTDQMGGVELIPLTGSGQVWEATVELKQEGLYTAEVVGFDAAGNWDRAVTYFGGIDFAGPEEKTVPIYLHEDWQFTESTMALASLPELTEKPEQTDQINEVETDTTTVYFIHGRRQGQSFKPSSIRLSGVELRLSRSEYSNPPPEPTIVVEVQSDAGGLPSGEVLTSYNGIPWSSLQTTPSWIYVDLPDINVMIDQTYHLVLRQLKGSQEPPECTDPFACEEFIWYYHSDTYARGRKLVYSSGAWAAWDNYDRHFRMYSDFLEDWSVDQGDGSYPLGGSVVDLTRECTAQKFAPAANTIAGVRVKLSKTPTFTADLWVEIAVEDISHLPGILQTRSYLQNEQIPLAPTWIEVDLANIRVDLSKKYFIVLCRGGTELGPPPNPENRYYSWTLAAEEIYVGGEAWEKVSNVWMPIGGDRQFEVLAADLDPELEDQTTGTTHDSYVELSGNSQNVAQSFIPSSGMLSRADVYISKSGGLDWDLTVRIVLDDGFGLPSTDPNKIVAVGKITPNMIPDTPYRWTQAEFQNVRGFPPSSQKYHIVLDPSPQYNPYHGMVQWYANTHDTYYERGSASYFDGSAWQPCAPPSLDRLFVTYTVDRTSESEDQMMVLTEDDFHSIDGSITALAQTFIPTAPILSEASLLLKAYGNMYSDVLVEVREMTPPPNSVPASVPMTRALIPWWAIPTSFFGPVAADFADIPVTPGTTLALVLTYVSPPTGGAGVNWSSAAWDGYYPLGGGWSYDVSWQELPGTDFNFQVFGVDRQQERVDQFQELASAYDSLGVGGLAQSFRPSLPVLTSVDLKLFKDSPSFNGQVVVEIRDANGNIPSSSVRARTLVPPDQIPLQMPGAPEWVTVQISDLMVDSSQSYFIVVWVIPDSGQLYWRYEDDNTYLHGNAAYWDGFGMTWHPLNQWDFAFRTHGAGYARVVTDLEVHLYQKGIYPPLVFSRGEFYGLMLSEEFAWSLNQHLGLLHGTGDEFGYVRIEFLFCSTTAGSILVWAEKLEFS